MSKISDLPVLNDAHGGAYIPVVWNGQNMRIYLSTIAASVENFTPYDPAVEYNRTTPDFVSYSGNVYEYIFATPSAGNLPTNTTYWRIASAGQFNHIQNTDLGTRNNSFDIQYQSQNQDVEGDTLLIFRGGQGGGTDTAIRNHWDASTTPATRKLQYTNNYTGGTDVWEDLGGISNDLQTILDQLETAIINASNLAGQADNNAGTALERLDALEITHKTGTVVDFAAMETHFGSEATPETGNITANHSGAVVGHMAFMTHQAGAAPTFGTEFHKIAGSGDYELGMKNYIYFDYRSATRINYSITQ